MSKMSKVGDKMQQKRVGSVSRKEMAEKLARMRSKEASASAPSKKVGKPVARKRFSKETKAAFNLGTVNADLKNFKAREAIRRRAARGEAPSTISIKAPARHLLALQVREDSQKSWGIVKAFSIHPYTTENVLAKHRKELTEAGLDWMAQGYFGPAAQFRVQVVITKSTKTTY